MLHFWAVTWSHASFLAKSVGLGCPDCTLFSTETPCEGQRFVNCPHRAWHLWTVGYMDIPYILKGCKAPLKEQFIMSIQMDKWAPGRISQCSKPLEIESSSWGTLLTVWGDSSALVSLGNCRFREKGVFAQKTVQLGLPPLKGLLLLDWYLVTNLPCDPDMWPYGTMTGGNIEGVGFPRERWLNIVPHSVRCRIISEISGGLLEK